ncbi:GFA family protein [uncultured Tateyamaria sp.]|uniref:GFA family protein n=1 Tax=Tateyamaria sp. 1078 TaxID=3417464 RepID=UPI002625CE71|nr:GFA family protein [uncultured Tateyamaria sp.]
MKLPLTGTCLCGAVQVTVSALPLMTMACHCRDCQKLSAGAYTLTTMVPRDSFSCTGDLVRGGLHSDGRAHYNCASCLTIVYSQVGIAPQRVNVRTSVLDDGAALVPFIEVMTEDKMPWVNVPAMHSFARAPASLDALHALMDDYAAWLS